MTENASNSFSRKNEKMLVFPKNAEKNASIIEKGLPHILGSVSRNQLRDTEAKFLQVTFLRPRFHVDHSLQTK